MAGWPTSRVFSLLARLGCSPERGCGLCLVLPTSPGSVQGWRWKLGGIPSLLPTLLHLHP